MAEWIASPNFKPGRTSDIKYIVIHWWDDPAKKPSITGVINHFKNPSVQVAAHYVVSGDRVVQMVKESDTAWHARTANPYTIGIEIDPQTPGNTYATVATLVREIRQRHGHLPLKKHSEFVQTSCPGKLDLTRIDREANAAQGGNAVNDKFTNEAEVKPFYMVLRGNEATLAERQGWVGKPKIDFITSTNSATEARNNATERNDLKKRVSALESELTTAKAQLQDHANTPTVDPVAAEKAKKYDIIKEALK